MKPNKKVSDAIILILIIMGIIIPITIIEGLKYNVLTNSTSDLNRGIQVTYEEIPQSDPIIILNPKECNILYHSRYDQQNILLNYRTAPGVIVEEYILDGEIPQPMPHDNIIQTPGMGNHTLRLTGKNSTGGSCSSELVYFYIGSKIYGVLGAAPDFYYYGRTVHLARSGNRIGVVTDTELPQEIFLEGPQIIKKEIDYIKKTDITCELLNAYVPFIILRSETWYEHSIEIKNSFWINLVSGGEIVGRRLITTSKLFVANDGETEIIYFLVNLLHVFGNVTYWNDETRYYDVITIETLDYFNGHREFYSANDSILDSPVLNPVDFSQFSGTYQDKNMSPNDTWGWRTNKDWIQSYGVQVSVFLGNYAGVNSCPVPVRFTLPQPHLPNDELMPDEIIHTFNRTNNEPDFYGANYRGLENTFSLNILPI